MSRAILHLALLALLIAPPAALAAEPATRGEAQVRRMCAERPALARALADHPPLRDWLAGEFDGRSIGFPIEWDGSEPLTGAAAEHEYPLGPGAARVRVRSGASGLDQLTGLVFELQNIRGFGTFEAAFQAALRGEIGRREFTERMAECEFGALTRTRAFLEAQLGALSVLELRDHPLTAHVLDASPTLEGQRRKYERLGHDIEERFGAAWDQEIKPRMIVAN